MSELFDPIATQTPLDETKNYLEELVGEGKKFKDANDLAKGKAFGDAHIATLERTLAEMRVELQTRKTAEELIHKISLANKQDPSSGRDPPVLENEVLNKSGLSAEDVEKMLLEREMKRTRDNNLNETSQKLREVYGDNAASTIQAKAQELGVSSDYLKSLAQDSPKVFISLFGKVPESTKEPFNAPPKSGIRTSSTAADTGEKWSDFQKTKRENPNLYWSVGYQRKLTEAADRAYASGRYEQFMNF